MRRVLALFIAALTALAASGAVLAEDAASNEGATSIHEEQRGPLFVIDGHFQLPAQVTQAEVWNVLSDYGCLTDFVKSLRKSVVRGRSEHGAVVEQQAEGKWFLFSRSASVLLDIHEDEGRSITFRDVLHKDFVRYRGNWRLSEAGTVVRVEYQLEAEPSASVPAFVIHQVFAEDAKALLNDVRDEILRRARLGYRNGNVTNNGTDAGRLHCPLPSHLSE